MDKLVRVSKYLDKLPGKRIFGIWRFMPVFFFLGAAMEYTMIHWHVGETNFYRTYKRRVVQEEVQKRLRERESAKYMNQSGEIDGKSEK